MARASLSAYGSTFLLPTLLGTSRAAHRPWRLRGRRPCTKFERTERDRSSPTRGCSTFDSPRAEMGAQGAGNPPGPPHPAFN
eukprot:9104206-Alexandrium_andersonii.AAC.1